MLRDEPSVVGEAERRARLRPAVSAAIAMEAELFVLCGDSRQDLCRRISALQDLLGRHGEHDLKDLAYTLNTGLPEGGRRLALVASSAAELHARLTIAARRLAEANRTKIRDVMGIYYFDRPLFHEGKLAILFPGEGSQYLNMLADLHAHFPEIADCFEEARRAADEESWRSLSRILLAPDDVAPREKAQTEAALRRLDTAVSTILLADWMMFQLLSQLGLEPAAVAGHSVGEIAALWAGGCLDVREMGWAATAAVLKALISKEAAGAVASTNLLAVGAGRDAVAAIMAAKDGMGIVVAMDNCPHQCVAVGAPDAVARLEQELRRRSILYERLHFERPYHTPLFEPYLAPLQEFFGRGAFRPAVIPVYSGSTGRPFPADPVEMRAHAVQNWAAPVEFTQMIRNMHADGVRIFVECGPRGNLTSFVEDTLRDETFAAVASNLPRRSGPAQINHLAAELCAHHVPLKLAHLYCRRNPQRLAFGPAATLGSAAIAGERSARETADASTLASAPLNGSSAAATPASAGRGDVLARHFQLMEQFISDQREIMEAYLARRNKSGAEERRLPAGQHSDATLKPGHASPAPLALLRLADVVQLEVGHAVVVRRRLDLTEDLFAVHHTIGGQAVSKVDPDAHGLPIMPMTFALELMAEVASLVVPGLKVTALSSVRLFRWLAFEEAPITIEISARTLPGAQTTTAQVQVEIRDLVDSHKSEARGPAMVGTVILAQDYPPSQPAGEFLLTDEHPCRVPVEVWYRNLFHGALFQGALPGGRAGDEGIENGIVVLPRESLLRSDPDPRFLIDPVLLDVAMHPLTGWHLEFPDQSGRILLPIELERVDLFAPLPAVGTRLRSRGTILASSYRHFVHAIDVIGPGGQSLWCRIQGIKFWRFYVPFAHVNFHGPKDEYFISQEWKSVVGGLRLPACCIRLDIPADQKHPGMLRVTGKVTLAPHEWREFSRMPVQERDSIVWLFDRLVAKDAVRTLWHSRHGERLFPCDIIIESDGEAGMIARARVSKDVSFPSVSVAHADDLFASVAAFVPRLGIDLACVRPQDGEAATTISDQEELELLEIVGRYRDEWTARFRSAKGAVAKALGHGQIESCRVAVRHVDRETGVVKIALDESLLDIHPQWRSRHLLAYTARDGNVVVGLSFGEGSDA